MKGEVSVFINKVVSYNSCSFHSNRMSLCVTFQLKKGTTLYCTLVPVLFPHYPIACPGDPKPFPYSTLSGEILEAGDETIILGHSKFAFILLTSFHHNRQLCQNRSRGIFYCIFSKRSFTLRKEHLKSILFDSFE